MILFLKEKSFYFQSWKWSPVPCTFILSAWLCGLYKLVHHGTPSFQTTSGDLVWFSSLKPPVCEFPFHKRAVNLFFFLSLQYHFKLTVSAASGFLTAESQSDQLHLQEMCSRGYAYLLRPAWNGWEHLYSWCQGSTGRQWPTASNRTASLLLFQLLST